LWFVFVFEELNVVEIGLEFFSGFGSIYLRDFLNTPPFISYTSSTFV
jgi:hypothetical protein